MFLTKIVALLSLVVTLFLDARVAWTEEKEQNETVRTYRTPEERRDAGIKHTIIEGLTLSGLIELEYEIEHFYLTDPNGDSEKINSPASLQGTLEAAPLEGVRGELVYEFDFEQNNHIFDEALISTDIEDLNIEVGKLYLPFGEYFTTFSTGSLIEKGESRGASLLASYDYEDLLEFSPFAFYGWSPERARIDNELEWGAALGFNASQHLKAGISYISNLNGSSFDIKDSESNSSSSKVKALSSFVTFENEPYYFSAEYLSALNNIDNFEPDRNKPQGWNFELSRTFTPSFALALKLEGSEEIEDQPNRRAGVGMNIKISDKMLFSLDFLHANHKRSLSQDENERDISSSIVVVGQISIGL